MGKERKEHNTYLFNSLQYLFFNPTFSPMLKRFLLLFLLLTPFSLPATDVSYPKNFYIQYQTLSYGTLFHVMQDNGTPFGKVVRKLGPKEQLLFYTLDDQLIVQAELEKNGSDTTAKVKWPNGEELGRFTATIYTIYPADFKLYINKNQLIAKGSMNWVGTRFTLTDPNNAHREFVIYSRSRSNFHADRWHIEINRQGEIDPALLVIIGSYQTSLNLGLEGY